MHFDEISEHGYGMTIYLDFTRLDLWKLWKLWKWWMLHMCMFSLAGEGNDSIRVDKL